MRQEGITKALNPYPYSPPVRHNQKSLYHLFTHPKMVCGTFSVIIFTYTYLILDKPFYASAIFALGIFSYLPIGWCSERQPNSLRDMVERNV